MEEKMKYANIDNDSNRRVYLFWLGFFSRLGLLLGLAFLIYYGYCWGMWGRNSLLLQHLFQCKCPNSSEEWRYPSHIDVIISACSNGGVRLSPNGRFLFVYDKDSNNLSNYIFDIQANERIPLSLPDGQYYFLNDNLLYVFVWYGGSFEGGDYIFDLVENKMHPIQRFVYSYPGSYIDGNADPIKLAAALREAKDLYLVNNSTETVVALGADFRNHPEQKFFMNTFDISGFDLSRVEKFLQQNNILYKAVLTDFPDEMVSPDGRFMARKDGIYLVETNRKIVEGIPWQLVRGWTSDSSGVIYSAYGSRCLLRLGFPFADDTWCKIRVPQPVLLFKVPEEYLYAAQTP